VNIFRCLVLDHYFVIELMFKGFGRFLTIVVFGTRHFQATCDLNFAARDIQSGPVREDVSLLACTLRLCRSPMGQRSEVICKSGATYVVG